MRIIATLAVIAALFVIGALARQSPQPLEPAAEAPSIQGYGDSNKTCQEWTDGCRSCRRSDAGGAVCSNIGIACQPKAVVCESSQ
jgi:hypothetical protein